MSGILGTMLGLLCGAGVPLLCPQTWGQEAQGRQVGSRGCPHRPRTPGVTGGGWRGQDRLGPASPPQLLLLPGLPARPPPSSPRHQRCSSHPLFPFILIKKDRKGASSAGDGGWHRTGVEVTSPDETPRAGGESGQALGQAAQGSGGVPIPGGVQTPSGCGPWGQGLAGMGVLG